MARALVTGGGGFIGSGVLDQLTQRGWSAVSLDLNHPPDARDSVDHESGDIRDSALVDRLVANADLVFHFAAVVGVDEYIQRSQEVLDVNIGGTRTVLEACQRHGRPVVLASSSEVYGRNGTLLREDAHKVYGCLTNVRWVYALSKAVGEEYAQSMAAGGLRFVSVRYFNVYGPNMDATRQGRVIAKFLRCIRDQQPLPLVDGGDAVRSFCYIDDATEATVRLGLALHQGSAVVNQPVNIGRYEPVSIRELATRMIHLSGHDAGVREVSGESFFGPGFEEIPFRVPDVTRLCEWTDFEARIDLDDGLRRTLAEWQLLRAAETTGDAVESMVPAVQTRVRPDDALRDRMTSILWSGRLSNDGPTVRELEREAAEYLGAREVVAVANGTLALEVALTSAGGGAVVLPSYTFIATVNAVVRCGLEPVLCDIDPSTFTLDATCLAAILSERSDIRVVLPVTVFGVPPDLDAIEPLARAADARLILDNAHGFGTETRGARLPAQPLAQTFSLHATKSVPAGEGGLLVTADAQLAAEARRLRNHGLAADVRESGPGVNAKMSELAAAVALHSLRDLPHHLEQRREHAERLRSALCAASDRFVPQHIPEGVRSNFESLGVACHNGAGIEATVRAFAEHGVEARRYFWPALHTLPQWRGRFALPVAEKVAGEVVCLPLHTRMTEFALGRVEAAIEAVARVLA